MQIVRSIGKMQKISRRLAAEGKRIGLVPTMGFLHEGHLSLIKRARKISDTVITSIFVNPAQFAPGEDLDKYPRDEKGDIAKIKEAGGDIVFIPKAADMYPDDFQTYVNVEKITGTLEGASRPGHFRGVTTIVSKLFNITRPDVAVFGQKDYQQAAVLKRMAADLDYPVKIVVAPTVRESDGLAMSSRNKYFTPKQRPDAVCLYASLQKARQTVRQSGSCRAAVLRRSMESIIKKICPTAEIDYIAFTDYETLDSVNPVRPGCIASLAVRVHGVRLIDNMKM
nr:pantoate--beta-alanine ligase [candidate division Zixibacteria bacterium]